MIILKHIDTSLPQGIKELRAVGRIIQRIVVQGGGILFSDLEFQGIVDTTSDLRTFARKCSARQIFFKL